TLEGSLADMNEGVSRRSSRNDLQPVAERLCPAIARVARWLEDRYGNSRMTGSGRAVFAEVVQDVAGGVNKGGAAGHQPVTTWCEGELPAGWVGRLCRSLPHHPLQGWAG